MSHPIAESSSAAAAAVAARKVSTGSTSSAADKRAEILRALRAENTVFKASPYGPDSALETEVNASASSLDLSTIVPASLDRIRRRSDLSRISQVGGEAIELPVLPPIDERNNAQASGVAPVPSQLSLSKVADIEVAPASYAPSVSYVAENSAPAATPAQRAAFRRNARLQFFALCYSFFLEGWNDGSTGPLLPRIERNYHIGFAIVSMLFVTNCVGFLSGAVMNVWLTHKLGLGKVLVLGAVIQLIGYAMMAPGGPFWVMCIAFVFAGYGISLQNAQGNGYVGNMKKERAHVFYGFLHASYGLGALVAPLVATQFSSARHWSFHYLISTGIAISNLLLLWGVFRLKNQNEIMREAGRVPEDTGAQENLYHQIMRLKEVHYLAVFSLIYVGVEVSIGGWIVTFIEDQRGGGASAGYISSGFFGGLMLGRILLMQLNRKLGERWVIIYYSIVVIILEITVWVVPSLIENAIAVSVVGLLMGPIYPVLMNQSTGILPKWLLTGCLGYIGGVGQAGSAVLPFITGLISSRFGIASLQPFIVSMMSTMIIIWALVPKARRIE